MHCLRFLEAEAPVSPLNAIDDVYDMVIEDSTPLEAIVEGEEESHSPSPQDDERNREYLIRRAALGDNPTQEETMNNGNGNHSAFPQGNCWEKAVNCRGPCTSSKNDHRLVIK